MGRVVVVPKINVYLPDELAEGVKETGVPVSAICQRALEQSVRRMAAIRATVLGDLETDNPTAQLSQFTERARAAITLAIDAARSEGAAAVDSEHLLHGLLADGQNLALQVLRLVEVEPVQVEQVLAKRAPGGSAKQPRASRFSASAASVLELTVTEAISLGHNYVGCEHLLLGLLSDPDGTGGAVLRELGVELRATRRAVLAALAGYTHLRAQLADSKPADASNMIAAAVRQELRPVLDRIERLEQQAGLVAGA